MAVIPSKSRCFRLKSTTHFTERQTVSGTRLAAAGASGFAVGLWDDLGDDAHRIARAAETDRWVNEALDVVNFVELCLEKNWRLLVGCRSRQDLPEVADSSSSHANGQPSQPRRESCPQQAASPTSFRPVLKAACCGQLSDRITQHRGG